VKFAKDDIGKLKSITMKGTITDKKGNKWEFTEKNIISLELEG